MTFNKPALEYCSLSYLNQWLVHDSGYHKVMTLEAGKDSTQKKSDALIKAGSFYSVARSLPTKYDLDKELLRYEPVIAIIDKFSSDDLGGATSADEIRPQSIEKIKQTADEIGGIYLTNKGNRRNVLSMTTKFLWLKLKSPVLIYDRNARVALNHLNDTTLRPNDLGAFYDNWLQAYTKEKDKIAEVCSNLHRMNLYAINEIGENEVKSLASQAWFQERVFDNYLWGVGAPD